MTDSPSPRAPALCAVVAMAQNRCIGRGNAMPWHIPEDFKHFRRVTMGKPVIMGRKTFESIGKPLPGRTNIVVSRTGFAAAGVQTVPTLEAALDRARTVAATGEAVDEIMIIGGGQIYAQALPLLDRIYMTVVEMTVEGDTFFPSLPPGDWHETPDTELPAADGRPACRFVTLERIR